MPSITHWTLKIILLLQRLITILCPVAFPHVLMSRNPNRGLRPALKLRLAHIHTKRSHTVLQMKGSHALCIAGVPLTHTHNYAQTSTHARTCTSIFHHLCHSSGHKGKRVAEILRCRDLERDFIRAEILSNHSNISEAWDTYIEYFYFNICGMM